MSDLNLLSSNSEDAYGVSVNMNAGEVSGNRLLLNRFQITFFDEGMFFDTDGEDVITDDFGGKAFSVLATSSSTADMSSISAAISAVVKNTVTSIKQSTPDLIPRTEMLDHAELIDVYTEKDMIFVSIDVFPVEIENGIVPQFSIPVSRSKNG